MPATASRATLIGLIAILLWSTTVGLLAGGAMITLGSLICWLATRPL